MYVLENKTYGAAKSVMNKSNAGSICWPHTLLACLLPTTALKTVAIFSKSNMSFSVGWEAYGFHSLRPSHAFVVFCTAVAAILCQLPPPAVHRCKQCQWLVAPFKLRKNFWIFFANSRWVRKNKACQLFKLKGTGTRGGTSKSPTAPFCGCC